MSDATCLSQPAYVRRREGNAARLPLDMRDSEGNRDAAPLFVAAGFTLGEQLDGKYRVGSLPKGWTFFVAGRNSEYVLDRDSNKRASLYEDLAEPGEVDYDAEVRITLLQRYNVLLLCGPECGAVQVILTDRGETIAAVGERLVPKLGATRKECEPLNARAELLQHQAAVWLDKHLPYWRSPLAYWEAPPATMPHEGLVVAWAG